MTRACVATLLFLLMSASTSAAQRRVTEEAQLFRRFRDGVVTVTSDQGKGSGFLVDSVGIILTNDHVVAGSSRIRVILDDSTRVEARLLASDPKRDVAALWIAPVHAAARPTFTLATPSDSMIYEGERVVAIGSPLNQSKIMTAGIVSKVEASAVISDVNINHGNSGGPLINMDGDVVAINTFGDFTTQGGPGVSGSILITEAFGVLDSARTSIATLAPPSPLRLRLPCRTPFPIDSLQAQAQRERFKSRDYDVSWHTPTGQFKVLAVTPVYDAWRTWRFDLELAKATKARERKGGVKEVDQIDPLREMRSWMQYTGDSYTPAVTLQMQPKKGQTAGSIFGNILGAAIVGAAGGSYYRGSYRYEFKADFKDVVVTRNGVEIPDLTIGRAMVPMVFANAAWDGDYVMEDQARVGFFQCDPEWFAPDSVGWPTIRVSITSVEKPSQPYEFNLPEVTVRRIWSDFSAFRSVVGVRDIVPAEAFRSEAQNPRRGRGYRGGN